MSCPSSRNVCAPGAATSSPSTCAGASRPADAGDEEAKQLLVLKVCLGEVERSRPFLIGILGDRYGWVPPPERMAAAAAEAGFDQPVAGRSVTELEIDFGVLSDPEQRGRSFFYFREPLPYDEMPPKLAAQYREAPNSEPAVRLDALKARLEREIPDRVRRYTVAWDAETQSVTGLESWGQQVLDDLWRELDAETIDRIQAGEPSWEEVERGTLEQFVEERAQEFRRTHGPGRRPACGLVAPGDANGRRGFLPHRVCRRGQERCHCRTPPPVGGRGRPGARPRGRHQPALDPGGCDAAALGGRARGGARRGQPLGPRSAGRGRRGCVRQSPWPHEHRAAHRDARRCPQPVRTDAPGPAPDLAAEALAAERAARGHGDPGRRPPRRWPAGPAPWRWCFLCWTRPRRPRSPTPSARATTGRLTRRCSLRCSRSAGPMDRLAAGNPLWLGLAVEELNLLDADDFARLEREFAGTPEERLLALLLAVADAMPPGVADLYAWLLERSEQIHGSDLAQTFVNLIAVSRAGWRESDFRALMPELCGRPWDDLEFAALRRTFRAHVVQRGAQAQWDFAHTQLRESVLRRNLAGPDAARGIHCRLGEYLEALPAEDLLHQSETMVHWIGADERGRAARYYGSELTEAEAFGATQALAASIFVGATADSNSGLAWCLSLTRESELSPMGLGRLCNRFNFDLHDALLNEGSLAMRAELLEAARTALHGLAAADPRNAFWQSALWVSHIRIGDVSSAQGDLDGALEAYQAAFIIAEHLATAEPHNAVWTNDLSVSHIRIGDVRKAQGDLGGALEAYQAALTFGEHFASIEPHNASFQRNNSFSHNNIGDARMAQGDLAGALNAYQAALDIRERLAAGDARNAAWQTDLSVSHISIGDVRRAQGDLGGALEAYQLALTIRERLVASDPRNAAWQRDLSVSHERVGGVRAAQGDLAGALEAYQASVTIAEHLASVDPRNTAWQRDLAVSNSSIGDVRTAQGDLGGALEAYQTALTITERLAAADPRNTIWQRDLSFCRNNIGDVRMAQGDLGGALEAYQNALTNGGRLAASDPRNADWQRDLSVGHNNIGDVRTAQGDLGGALEAYQIALTIRERLTASDPHNTTCQHDLSESHDNIGDVRTAQGGLDGALEAYQAAFTIRERLASVDPRNTAWQRSLAASHNSIGDVCTALGDLDGALEAYQAALTIAEHLASVDPRNTAWQRGLAVSRSSIGDVCRAQGDLYGALDAYQAALTIRERLAAADPRNAAWQSDLSVSYNSIGDVRTAQGDLGGALEAYQAALTIRERLAAADPHNTTWQRNLSVSYDRIGDACTARGDLGGALEAYQAALTIAGRLVAVDRSNAAWQRDLSVSHNKIGDVRMAHGDIGGAMEAYRAALIIAEYLVAADPHNAAWQRDLLVSHGNIGDVRTAHGDLAGALEAYQASLTIAERLATADPLNAAWQRNLMVSHSRIGNVCTAHGDLGGALESYRVALTIAERLAAADPRNAAWEIDLSVSHEKIGGVRKAQGDLDGALDAYQAALTIRERLAAADLRNAAYKRDLVVSFSSIATVLQDSEPNAAQAYWSRCRDTLEAMSAAGMHLDPPLQELLQRLESSRAYGRVDEEPANTTNPVESGGSEPMKLAMAYKDFLDKEGYRATINDSGSVQFKKEGWIFFIIVDESDPAYFRLHFPGFLVMESAAEKERAYVAAHDVGSSIKVGKIVVDGDSVHAVCESLVPDFDAVPGIFNRAVSICRSAAEKFIEAVATAPDAEA